MVESFAKTSVLFGRSKYFQKHLLSQRSYFIKPLQISTVFLLFHVDMEAKERKNVATCMFSTSYFQVFGFFRHENQSVSQVTFLRYVMLLDFSLSFRKIYEVLKKFLKRQCGEITVMISSSSFNCLKINKEKKVSQLFEGEDQSRIEAQKSSSVLGLLPGLSSPHRRRVFRVPFAAGREGEASREGGAGLSWWEASILPLSQAFRPQARCADTQGPGRLGWRGLLWGLVWVCYNLRDEVMSKLLRSTLWCCEPSMKPHPSASKRKKCPKLTPRASAHDHQWSSWVENKFIFPISVVMYKRWKTVTGERTQGLKLKINCKSTLRWFTWLVSVWMWSGCPGRWPPLRSTIKGGWVICRVGRAKMLQPS